MLPRAFHFPKPYFEITSVSDGATLYYSSTHAKNSELKYKPHAQLRQHANRASHAYSLHT